MPIYEVRIWVSETRYYTVEAENEEDAYDKVEGTEPSFIKNHDQEVEVTEENT